MRLVQWPTVWCINHREFIWRFLTDEASVISGSMGLMPSASVGDTLLHYMSLHGIPTSNRFKYCKSVSDCAISGNDVWRCLWLTEEAAAIRAVVNKSLEKGL
jgi:3-isopropylmalate dehydrogenase